MSQSELLRECGTSSKEQSVLQSPKLQEREQSSNLIYFRHRIVEFECLLLDFNLAMVWCFLPIFPLFFFFELMHIMYHCDLDVCDLHFDFIGGYI